MRRTDSSSFIINVLGICLVMITGLLSEMGHQNSSVLVRCTVPGRSLMDFLARLLAAVKYCERSEILGFGEESARTKPVDAASNSRRQKQKKILKPYRSKIETSQAITFGKSYRHSHHMWRKKLFLGP
ncbi:uncharacterized protein MYCFIDRAFT_203981 [Pseudocercospora fijiensis CIRAD86]|uniref:Uncharacterized protein n=1 Tax=Pseudocercospora fijiensis (strain CIRAD86) TaxID=383855 RepID=M3AYS0_PSEFD|nr:uncharacterized protein MYCFIDRAFT_203981 [Pseudocercospora fijiensis CIRAD86]EME82337.1 hypothetical protein MYCFIDRAFT_203981 [Pseudocercospora fijiensis CIRAD86]